MLAANFDFAAKMQQKSPVGDVDQRDVRNSPHCSGNLLFVFRAGGGDGNIANRLGWRRFHDVNRTDNATDRANGRGNTAQHAGCFLTRIRSVML